MTGNFTYLNGMFMPYNESLNGTFANVTMKDVLNKDDRMECKKDNGSLDGAGCGTPFYVADVFFFSCLLFIGTFTLAMSLKLSRNASFFPTVVRQVFIALFDISVLCARGEYYCNKKIIMRKENHGLKKNNRSYSRE